MGKDIAYYKNILSYLGELNFPDFVFTIEDLEYIKDFDRSRLNGKLAMVNFTPEGVFGIFMEEYISNFLYEQYNFDNDYVNSLLMEYTNIFASHIATGLHKNIFTPQLFEFFGRHMLPDEGVVFTLNFSSEVLSGTTHGFLSI